MGEAYPNSFCKKDPEVNICAQKGVKRASHWGRYKRGHDIL